MPSSPGEGRQGLTRYQHKTRHKARNDEQVVIGAKIQTLFAIDPRDWTISALERQAHNLNNVGSNPTPATVMTIHDP